MMFGNPASTFDSDGTLILNGLRFCSSTVSRCMTDSDCAWALKRYSEFHKFVSFTTEELEEYISRVNTFVWRCCVSLSVFGLL